MLGEEAVMEQIGGGRITHRKAVSKLVALEWIVSRAAGVRVLSTRSTGIRQQWPRPPDE